MKKRILVVIPAFNEETTIKHVITSIPKRISGFTIVVLVVDDGSTDRTGILAKQSGAQVLRHIINRGLGGALSTGFFYARKYGFDIVVTFDADGQHTASDIARVIKPIVKKEYDVVIGSRFLTNQNSMPIIRKYINILSNIATYIFFGIGTTDSQSGLRAFSKNAVKRIAIQTQRMEVSSEIFSEIKKHELSKTEIPIEAIYTDYSLRKGQKVSNASNVLLKLFLRKFKTVVHF